MADGERVLIPIDPGAPHPLGRHQWHDPQNRMHRALEALQPIEATPRTAPWYTRDVYSQRGSSCTANAAIGVLRTSPFRSQFTWTEWGGYDTEDERYQLYRVAQTVDPWPGEEPAYEGSSTDAPFKVLRDRGIIGGWKWLFGSVELWHFLELYGPASIGINWYDSMFYPDASGFIRPTGGVAGGHAIRCVYHDVAKRRTRLVNSWGRTWGQEGRCWIRDEDLARLIDDERGECVTVVQ